MEQTIQIETNKRIRFENLASFRKKMKQSEIQLEVAKFVQFLKQSEAKKNGPMISATFGAEIIDGEQILDMEFLVPLDRKIVLHPEYRFKLILHLVHAIYTRYIGNPLHIDRTYNDLINYMQQNQLQQITVAYNVNVNDERVGQSEEPIIDIYIGVNPSLL